jgi:hypothetical protein
LPIYRYLSSLAQDYSRKVGFAASSIPGTPVRETKLVKTPFCGMFAAQHYPPASMAYIQKRSGYGDCGAVGAGGY